MQRSQTGQQKKKIVWISPLILDVHLHKTTQIEILQALTRRGHKVFLFASYSSKKSLHELLDVPATLIPLRHVPFFSTFSYIVILLLYLPFFFIRWKPDFVIVEPGPVTFSVAPMLLLPRSKRPKIVLDVRSGPVGKRRISTAVCFDIALFKAKKFFQRITTITPLSKKKLCEKYNISSRFVDVWTSGVSITAFNPENCSGTEMKKKLGLENKFVILYHGSFGTPNAQRGIIETIKAIGLLKGRYPNLVLFLLGNGGYGPKLKELIRQLGIRNMIVIHNPVSYVEVPKYIAMCDVGIIPLPNFSYWRHQCPLNLLECLAIKKVVIATDIPANREVLGKCKCGIYASSADPKEIATAIVYAYNNKKMLRKWGAYGRMIVENRYSWDKMAEDLEAYLLQL